MALTLAIVTLLVVLAVWCQGIKYDDFYPSAVQDINAKARTWRAGYNSRFSGLTKEHMSHLLGALVDNNPKGPKKIYLDADPLPQTFDSSQNWPSCARSIGFIRDQSDCGSCWAVSSSEVMSDRICIKSNGTTHLYISDEDILSCCTACGDGCKGGWPLQAFKYWDESGVVTGGPYGSKDGCRPYSIAPCDSRGCPMPGVTPKCERKCEDSYKIPYPQDERKGLSYYNVQGGAASMQKEIFDHGPIVACFAVYEDFYHYVSGIYQHAAGAFVGNHAVKVVGWGVDGNVPYWLVANSWNSTWGMNGYFKIKRGSNECGFEQSVSAGLP